MKKIALLAALAATLTATAANTLAWWTFDDDPLGATDASGNFNTLTNGGVAIVDGAASFDGTAKPFHTVRPLPVNPEKAYTFECFVRPLAKRRGQRRRGVHLLSRRRDGAPLVQQRE